jgi:signal peptidase II
MKSRLWWLAIAVLVFVIDRATKRLIQSRVSFWDSYTVIPNFFSIVHTENRGAAFGMFAESASEWRSFVLIGLSLAVIGLIISILWRPMRGGMGDSAVLRAGLALVLGGALGNVYDRIVQGTVTDFLEFYFGAYIFPAFNAADSAITVGAVLLLIDMWRGHRAHSSVHAAETN